MKVQIDFDSYSLEELYDSASNIDREKFPKRAAYIDSLIVEKESSLPDVASGRYYYKRNLINLLNGFLFLSLSAIAVYWIYAHGALDSKFDVLQYIFLAGAAVLFVFAAFKSIRVYIKLYGVERFIEIKDGVLSMPGNSYSLKQVDIPISDIHELYYRPIRRGLGAVSSLEIIYGFGETASIVVGHLSKQDFYAVCNQLQEKLNLDKIKTKYT